jgi:VWFA-related protein
MDAKLHARAAIAASLALCLATAAPAQEPDTTVELRGSEVLLDLVVTDKRGRPLGDLRRDEVVVLENGAPQHVTSFGLVRIGDEAAPPAGGGPAGSGPAGPLADSPLRNTNLILVVVDRGTVGAGNLVQVKRASERFVRERLATNDLVAVFAATDRLVLLQNFTSNKDRLLSALERATAGTSVQLQESLDPAAREMLAEAQSQAGKIPSDTPEAKDQELNRRLGAAAAGIDTTFAALRDQIQTLAVVNSLLALTKLYAPIAGRKSIVLFSEGFVLTDDAEGPFAALVGAANRGNFTIYPVSAAGLTATVRTGNVMPRRGTPIEESDDRMAVSGGESGLDRMVRPTLTNNDQALNRLAGETGGLLVRNTNDLGRGFEAIGNDLRSYYALSYAPSNGELDGSFRTIEVRVARKDVEVRARKGYYAVPGGSGVVQLPFEQPLLAALSGARRGAAPAELKVAVKTERFPSHAGWRVPIVLGVAAADLAPVDAAPSSESVDFVVHALALVRDATGRVVTKLSRATTLRVRKEQLEAFRSSEAPIPQFDEPLVLAPGRYEVEIAVLDPVSKRSSVVERRITVPALPAPGTLAVSSLVLARSAERVGAGASAASDPFVVGGVSRVLPSASARFSKSRGDRLIALFSVRPTPNAPLRMQLQFLKGDTPVTSTPIEPVPAADASGLSSVAPILPLDGLEPGDYRAVVLILGPDSTTPLATAMTSFRVEE